MSKHDESIKCSQMIKEYNSKFKVGVRVRVYGYAQVCAGFAAEGDAGQLKRPVTITDIFCASSTTMTPYSLRVKCDNSDIIYSVHPKQCRILKPKVKSVRVTRSQLAELWNKYVYNGYTDGYPAIKSASFSGLCIEFGL